MADHWSLRGWGLTLGLGLFVGQCWWFVRIERPDPHIYTLAPKYRV